MKKALQSAAAEKSLGFLTLDLKARKISWSDETADILGAQAAGEAAGLLASLQSGLRAYFPRTPAEGGHERQRTIVPLKGEVMELVILPHDLSTPHLREGFFSPYPLQESMELMKKYYLSNISNKLRSLLNSVIIASDVVAASDKAALMGSHKFLDLMAQDAREVNTLLNRLGEVINYSPVDTGGREEIGLAPLLESIHSGIQCLAEDASISLQLALPGDLPVLRGSRTRFMLAFFLALHYALSNTEPLGEIITTAQERNGWAVQICYAGGGIPADLAVQPEKHGLIPAVLKSWSESYELQIIDSLLALSGGGLSLMGDGRGVGLLKVSLGRE